MSNLLGRIDEYDGTKEEWPQYVERIDHFFTANGIGITDANRKQSAFLAVIGPAADSLAKPGDKSYDELVKALTDHFNPTPSETLQIPQPFQEARRDCCHVCL